MTWDRFNFDALNFKEVCDNPVNPRLQELEKLAINKDLSPEEKAELFSLRACLKSFFAKLC